MSQFSILKNCFIKLCNIYYYYNLLKSLSNCNLCNEFNKDKKRKDISPMIISKKSLMIK